MICKYHSFRSFLTGRMKRHQGITLGVHFCRRMSKYRFFRTCLCVGVYFIYPFYSKQVFDCFFPPSVCLNAYPKKRKENLRSASGVGSFKHPAACWAPHPAGLNLKLPQIQQQIRWLRRRKWKAAPHSVRGRETNVQFRSCSQQLIPCLDCHVPAPASSLLRLVVSDYKRC